jgi:predicted phosphodiesterase
MPRKPKARVSQPLFAEPVFAEGVPTPDPSQFTVTPDDSADYTSQVNALLYTEVVSFPQASGKPGDLFSLETAWGPNGPAVIQSINTAQAITFHMIGDSGATAQSTFPAMIKVSDAVTNDFHSASVANRPSFLFHLGDLVYNFGESVYYYDEFYEPYRNYPAPIFAIPGNHDSFVLPNTPKGSEPLTIFQRNFCSTTPTVTVEAGSLHRTSMTQLGVYFALDAPYVRIIGLFSNALEDPGVISSQTSSSAAKSKKATKTKKGGNATGGTPAWPVVPDYQLAFLAAQLQNIKSSNYQGAVILAVHHPPFIYSPPSGGSGGGTHYGSPFMLADIDTVCNNVGVYPHAVISGHAHNYQRYTRKLHFSAGSYSVPFIVCGDGGHNVDTLVKSSFGKQTAEPGNNLDVSYMDTGAIVQSTGLTLDKHDDQNSGFLRVQATSTHLTITFNPVPKSGTTPKPDTVTVNLAAHTAA